MPREYTLVVRKNRNQEEFITIYLTDGHIDMVSHKASPLHDATHPIVASFLEAIGIKIKSDIDLEHKTYRIPKQAGILNEVLIGGITFQTIPKYKQKIRDKVINSLQKFEIYNHHSSIVNVLKYETELIKITSIKYLKESLRTNLIQSGRLSQQANNKLQEELLKAELNRVYPELERYTETLKVIFRWSRILGKKINQNHKSIVVKWNQIADRHEQWLINYTEKQDFIVRSKVKEIDTTQQYQVIVNKINDLITQLPNSFL